MSDQAFETRPSGGEGSCNPFVCFVYFPLGKGWWLRQFSSPPGGGGGRVFELGCMLNRGKSVYIYVICLVVFLPGFQALIRHHELKNGT